MQDPEDGYTEQDYDSKRNGHGPMKSTLAVRHQESVLMLTQETQTENRSLIKYLLTLINETMMRQLQDQANRISKEEFDEALEQFQQVIPNVYDQVKEQSDTFFVEE